MQLPGMRRSGSTSTSEPRPDMASISARNDPTAPLPIIAAELSASRGASGPARKILAAGVSCATVSADRSSGAVSGFGVTDSAAAASCGPEVLVRSYRMSRRPGPFRRVSFSTSARSSGRIAESVVSQSQTGRLSMPRSAPNAHFVAWRRCLLVILVGTRCVQPSALCSRESRLPVSWERSP